ncbi:MAG: ABC transporter permease [Saprospiraceae bacterium]|nr:ABC transporter permease [Saprospiraceae bacterium]
MFKTYLTTALRSLLKRKANSFINIAGLALGIAAALVIVLFARNELTYDQHHANADHTYLVYKERVTPNGVQPTYDTWVPLLERLQTEFPEVDLGTRLFATSLTMEVANQRFEEECYFVDASYFDVFDFPVASGNAENPFTATNSIVISKNMATKLFGDVDPIGQEIQVNFEQVYTVSAILEDYPRNGFIGQEILLPIQSFPRYEEAQNNWGGSFLMTYVTLHENADQEVLASKFPDLIQNIWDEETAARTNFKLLPLHAAYDTFVGDSKDSYILLYIALGILLIAATNFMNLSTARSMDRAREIGMRKVLGAAKRQVATQFLIEAIIVTFIALIFGLILATFTLPVINSMFDMDLVIPFFSEPLVIPGLLVFGLLLGLLSGSYPSFVLASFGILEILSEAFRSNKAGGVSMRNVLVVLQFTISILLIVGTISVARQISYVKNADLSFNQDNLMVIPVGVGDFEDGDEARLKLETFREELSKNSNIRSLSASRHVPGRWSESNVFVQPEGWEGDPMRMRYTFMDANFFDNYEIALREGRGFLPDSEGDQRESVVLNEAAMRAFGWADIADKNIMIGRNKIQVVGLIEDFNYETLRSEVQPILHFHRVPSNTTHRYLSLRTSDANFQETLAFLKSNWTILDDSRPLNYFFVSDDIKTLYSNEDRLLRMVKIFAFLSIFISCLGLFGLLSFNLDKRKKEIGIRKVLGASASGLMLLISNEFSKLILISFVLACPIAYYAVNSWLDDFAYHITLGWQIFVLALLLTVTLALLTISFKTVKAANANPIDSIYEG